MDTFQSIFNNASSKIGANIQKIFQNVASMKRMESYIGSPEYRKNYFSPEKHNKNLDDQLHGTENETKKLVTETSGFIKALNGIFDRQSSSNSMHTPELRRALLQKERLTNDFINALNGFKKVQQDVAEKEKVLLKSARRHSAFTQQGIETQKNNLIDLGSSPEAQKIKLQQQEQDYNLEQLEEREEAIRQLESDIVDVNTIFKDLATMVHDQGSTVDSIEANIEHTTIRVHEGANELKQAELYKNKARKKKVILSIVGIIVLIIIIAIIVWQCGGS